MLVWASYVFAGHQTVMDPLHEQTIAACNAADIGSNAFGPVPDTKAGWDHGVCDGTPCESAEDHIHMVERSDISEEN